MFESLRPCGVIACQAPLSFTISWSLLKFGSFESAMLFNHLILCRPLLLLPSIFPNIRVFCSESALLIRWPKYWNFNFSISSSNEYSGLISFRIDWFDLLAVQGNLIEHHILSRGFLVMPALFDLLSLGCGGVGGVYSQCELFFSAPG